MNFHTLRSVLQPGTSKIVLVMIDGLGGLPVEPDGLTELETAHTPNLDRLAAEGITGLHVPVAPGFTPGSGPGHLGVFGYDPLTYTVGRGVLSAAGIDFDLQPNDVAARGNFCTIDNEGRVVDRRAGRIDTETNRRLCQTLAGIGSPGVRVFVEPIKEHRFLLVLRGEGLADGIADTDPQRTGVEPLEPEAQMPESGKTAEMVASFIMAARKRLADEPRANMVLMRGFAQRPDWPSFRDVYGLSATAAASYPMYRGLARLLGMDVSPPTQNFEQAVGTVAENFGRHDFFFAHAKHADSSGEDGDFDAKVSAIEAVDAFMPDLRVLGPDVVIVTGDHSTPSVLRSHSWHPVPILLWSKYCRSDSVQVFGERACIAGGLGPRFPAVDIMPLALANAQRLSKFGA